jgi:hypothetical protein
MIKLRAPGPNPVRIRPVQPSAALAAWYETELDKLIKPMCADVAKALLPIWHSAPKPVLYMTFPHGEVKFELDEIETKWQRKFAERANALALGMTKRVLEYYDMSFADALNKAGIGIPKPAMDGDVEGHEFHGNQWTGGAGTVMREAGQRVGSENVDKISRPGHFYRGMTEAEFNNTVGAGAGIKSNQAYSLRGEGTSLSDDAGDAESYVNYGRDDPRTAGRPTYLVEVKGGDNIKLDKRDGYHKAQEALPMSQITRAWEMRGNEKDEIVGKQIIAQDADLEGHAFHGNRWTGGIGGETKAVDLQSKEFKAWFKDSKIVDSTGAPLRVFHGTDAPDISSFNIPENGVAYFTPDADYPYITKSDVGVPVYLSMQHPFYTENLSWIEGARDDKEWVQQLKDKGHDGIIYSRKGDLTGRGPSGWGDDYVQICVFAPEQIKSSITNSGKFSGKGLGDSALAMDARKDFNVKFYFTKRLQETAQAHIDDNIALIHSIPEQFHRRVKRMAWKSIESGRDIAGFINQLEEEFDITLRRASLIARDQNNKMTAMFHRTRRLDLGLTTAIWRHTHSSLHPREEHIDFDGEPYSIEEGMYSEEEGENVWPGTMICCGCVDETEIPGYEEN